MKCKSKPQWNITSYLLEWLVLKKEKKEREREREITSIDKDVEKRNLCALLGMSIGIATMEKKFRGSSKKLKRELYCDQAISFLGIYPKEMKTGYQKDIWTPMFIATLFTIAKMWKQP